MWRGKSEKSPSGIIGCDLRVLRKFVIIVGYVHVGCVTCNCHN